MSLELYFSKYREKILGINAVVPTPYGTKKVIYADWIAGGRLYRDIEEKMMNEFAPFVANTHSESSSTGTIMTRSYHYAHKKIKQHVNSNEDDVIITSGSGMTGVINKFQRILGLRVPEKIRAFVNITEEMRPVVFITHMEHHSNQTSWYETICEVVVVPPDEEGLVSTKNLEIELEKYKHKKIKIGAFSACSNVTGIITPYHELAEIMHNNGGYCFVDFACSAPYVNINMHPENTAQKLDAIFFSPHKFLGGPGTPGVLVFNSLLYENQTPDDPGGGTVDWTNPWGEYKFVDDIEAREDGGTPPFLQTIKACLAVELKESMGVMNIVNREHEIIPSFIERLEKINRVVVLAGKHKERLGAISFYMKNVHYNLIVRLMNDRFGIQVRGGCSCAGTYGHYLLNVQRSTSHLITEKINHGDLSEKPGWVRISLHPVMTNDELNYILYAIKEIEKNEVAWASEYKYDQHKNEFSHINGDFNPDIKKFFHLF